MRAVILSVPCAVALTLVACGGGGGGDKESALQKSLPPPTKSLSDLKQAASTQTEEELAEARKKAGFKSRDELAKENAVAFEKDAKTYIKTRADKYKGLLKDLKGLLADIEKSAPKWKDAKDLEKFSKKFGERVKEVTKAYDELTAHGSEGGETQVILGKAVREFEALHTGLTPESGKDDALKAPIEAIRKSYDEVEQKVTEIEKDETLTAAAEGADAKAGDKKADGDPKAGAKGDAPKGDAKAG